MKKIMKNTKGTSVMVATLFLFTIAIAGAGATYGWVLSLTSAQSLQAGTQIRIELVEWDLENKQEVWLENQDGVVSSNSIKVRVTERIRYDSVYMVHGFGHTQKQMSRSYKRGVSDSELITKVLVDPEMGGTGMRGNFVTFLMEQPMGGTE